MTLLEVKLLDNRFFFFFCLDAKQLQKDLDRLGDWSLKWDMEFNPSKCTVIHVTCSKSPVPSQYILYDHVLESVSSTKYLGSNNQ